jgi:hypothetical protein
MQHVKIRNDLFLVQHSPAKAKRSAPVSTNHLWLFDRSGSMYGLLHSLIHDLKGLVRTLKPSDTVTLGWFSGPREYNYIVKGFKIANDADYVTLDKMLDKHASTVGMTCFSEILASTKQVIEDLSVFSKTFSLVFLTDGYPTVPSYNKEVETIFKAVTDIRGSISSALLVGYGNYYNRPLMTDISERLGAALTHSEGIKDFRSAVDGFLKDSGKSAKVKVALDIPYAKGTSKYPVAFSIAESGVNILAQDTGVVYAPEGAEVYVLSNVRPASSAEITPREKDVRHSSDLEDLIKGVYGASYILCQLGKTDQAMEALATLGDVYLIDALTNAYTPSEYGVAEKKILHAINDPDGRYFKGWKKNYLPPVDAYCLLDVLDELLDDGKALFYPYHKSFDYKRIGVKAEASEDTPKFRADPVGVPISSLVWNSTKLNLSVAARITGKIHLIGEASKYGFSDDYPTWVHRNYALVKDGFLNVKTLPVSLSEETFTSLRSRGLIDSTERYIPDGIYDLHLDVVPVINRAMAEGKTSATELADKVRKEYELKGILKSLKYFKDEEVGDDTEKVGVFASLNDEQIAFLESNHIGKNGFSPKVAKGESTDFYYAKSFEIKVKGLSSFPKVSDVQDKIKAGKKLTVADTFVHAGIDLYEKSGMQKQEKEVRVAWLTIKIASLLKEQRAVSRAIQETKFAVLLAKSWFKEFQTREDNVLTVGDLTYTFALREVKEDF